jgi:hypothetical protein
MEKKEFIKKWISISITDWYKNQIREPLFVARGSEIETEHGYFEDYYSLTKEENKILMDNLECFYYYGKKCDNNEITDCECYLGREFGSMYITLLFNIEDDIVEDCIKPLLKEHGIIIDE